jgi:hypothetical protein
MAAWFAQHAKGNKHMKLLLCRVDYPLWVVIADSGWWLCAASDCQLLHLASLFSLQLSSLRKELDTTQQQLQRVERLIHIADPDGWYKPGASSSMAAAAAAKAALEAERRRRAAAVAAQRAGWAAAQAQVSHSGCEGISLR